MTFTKSPFVEALENGDNFLLDEVDEPGPKYLTKRIVDRKLTSMPPSGYRCLTVDGYTKRSGAPTHTMVMLEGESRWRRVYFWCFSNCSTEFIKVKGENLIIR